MDRQTLNVVQDVLRALMIALTSAHQDIDRVTMAEAIRAIANKHSMQPESRAMLLDLANGVESRTRGG